jgi:hypothetical protein
VRLCAAVTQTPGRAACQAIALHDGAPCGMLSSRSEAGACARAADRWRAAIPSFSQDARVAFRTTGMLHVEAVGADRQVHVDVGLEPDVQYGVVLAEERNGAHLVVGPLSESGVDFVAPSPSVRPSLAFELFVSKGAAAPVPKRMSATADTVGARIERAELILPGHPATATPIAHSTLQAVLSHFEPARGAPLQMTIDGTLGDAAGEWRVHAEVATFVRDVVERAASRGSDPPMSQEPTRGAPEPVRDPAFAPTPSSTIRPRPLAGTSAEAPP